jgi:hypothetical protein
VSLNHGSCCADLQVAAHARTTDSNYDGIRDTVHYLQVAGFTQDCSYDTVFQIVSPDPAHRIASEGVPVLAHVPLCIQHCATSALLHLTDASYPNEFVSDKELTFNTTRSSGKKALLHHENRGQLTGTIPSKHSDPNFFVFLIGSTVQELPTAMCVSDVSVS